MLSGFAAIFFWSSLICESTELLPPPKTLPRRMSPIPVEPEPTPKATKPTPKTSASSTNIHLACRRRREKKSWSSQLGAACLRFGFVSWRLRCACVAPRAIGFLGYLAFELADGDPIELLAHRRQVGLRGLVAE